MDPKRTLTCPGAEDATKRAFILGGNRWEKPPITLVQRQHDFDGLLGQLSLLPLPPGEGRGESPSSRAENPLTLSPWERGKKVSINISLTVY